MTGRRDEGVDDHLTIEHFSEVARRPGSSPARATLQHLVSRCPECRRHWQQLHQLQPVYLACLDGIEFVPPRAPREETLDDLDTSCGAIASQEVAVAELRRLHQRAKEELWLLLRLPREQRAGTIRGAYRRFRSRQLAEMLIRECRVRVRNDPADAQALAELIPLVLRWAGGTTAPTWVRGLLTRATALRGNALRIAGDLPGAERVFMGLRGELAVRPLTDAGVLGDLWALEASLRKDLLQFADAEQLVSMAALAYELCGDRLGLARARIKQGNLLLVAGRPDEIVPLLNQAESLLGADPDPWLLLCTVVVRINALADLGHFGRANSLLLRQSARFERSNDASSLGGFRCVQGRVAFGLGRFDEAAACFSASRDAMLSVGRPYDAAWSSLYLTATHRAAGQPGHAERLARDLVPEFRARGVDIQATRAVDILSGRFTR